MHPESRKQVGDESSFPPCIHCDCCAARKDAFSAWILRPASQRDRIHRQGRMAQQGEGPASKITAGPPAILIFHSHSHPFLRKMAFLLNYRWVFPPWPASFLMQLMCWDRRTVMLWALGTPQPRGRSWAVHCMAGAWGKGDAWPHCQPKPHLSGSLISAEHPHTHPFLLKPGLSSLRNQEGCL